MKRFNYHIFGMIVLLMCSLLLVSCEAIMAQNITNSGTGSFPGMNGGGPGMGGGRGMNGGPGMDRNSNGNSMDQM